MSTVRTGVPSALLALVMLAGCTAPPVVPAKRSGQVILLPEPDGKSSAVTVKSRQGESRLLDKPYAAVDVFAAGPIGEIRLESAESVARRYGDLIQALPPRPVSAVLFVKPGGVELTDDSTRDLAQILQQLKATPLGELIIVGHTDTVGSLESNDQLSKRRAEALKQKLVEQGIASDRIATIGRGKRQLLVPTADQVDEPKNRRLELIAR
jgi:OmpA-OmpF porin, OOP family